MKVYPNPFAALDARGLPCCVVPMLPPAVNEYVGATLCKQRTIVHEHPWEGAPRRSDVTVNGVAVASRPQTNHWLFNGISCDEPKLKEKLFDTPAIEVPEVAYFINALKAGELLAGDRETAVKFGVDQPPARAEKASK